MAPDAAAYLCVVHPRRVSAINPIARKTPIALYAAGGSGTADGDGPVPPPTDGSPPPVVGPPPELAGGGGGCIAVTVIGRKIPPKFAIPDAIRDPDSVGSSSAARKLA